MLSLQDPSQTPMMTGPICKGQVMPLHTLISWQQKPKETLCAYPARLFHVKLQDSFKRPNNSTASAEQLLHKEGVVKITLNVSYFNSLFLLFYPSNPLLPIILF